MQSTPDQPPKWAPLPLAWREAAFQQSDTVLLESSLPSRTQHHSYLFTRSNQTLTATSPDELPGLFDQIEKALRNGQWAAGYLAYEAGPHFVGLPSHPTKRPLAIFGIFDAPRIFDHTQLPVNTPTPEHPAPLTIAPMLRIRREHYAASIARIQQWIAAGETYQLNYTTHAASPYSGDAAALYDALQVLQPCSYGAIVRLHADQTILSLSPELFFRAAPDGTLTTKPMKGTSKPGATPDEDLALTEALRSDEKNRAEHVMIVDLLRNDLGRICEAGSVQVDRLFDVERYPTLLQMTSTISGRTPPQTTWYQVFRALFPSGSITGAPKRHTMELIGQIEAEPRGVYTGAIGYFAPDRSACFNVAIRTVVLERGTLTLGIGGGIVADSTAEGEYEECLLKTAFMQRAAQPVELIETMRWTFTSPGALKTATNPGAPFMRDLAHEGDLEQFANLRGIPLLPSHLQRLGTSAASLGFRFDARSILATIAHAATQWNDQPKRLRLLLHRDGSSEIQHAEAPVWPGQLSVALSAQLTFSEAPHLRHKSTFRPEYEAAFRESTDAGYDEALFQNESGEITEGCISSILVCLDGRWYTPPLNSGCLPGVYRAALLEVGQLKERTLTVDDLRTAHHLCICNAVRGTGSVASLQLPCGERIRYRIAASPPQLPAW